jgi:hypothetical protein
MQITSSIDWLNQLNMSVIRYENGKTENSLPQSYSGFLCTGLGEMNLSCVCRKTVTKTSAYARTTLMVNNQVPTKTPCVSPQYWHEPENPIQNLKSKILSGTFQNCTL